MSRAGFRSRFLCFAALAGLLCAPGISPRSAAEAGPRLPEGTISGPCILEPFPGVRLNLRSGWHMLSGPAMYTELRIPAPTQPIPQIMLFPDNYAWTAVLSHVDTGFIPLDPKTFNIAAVRRNVQSVPIPDLLAELRGVGMVVKFIGWIDPPVLDPLTHTAQYLARFVGDGMGAYGRGVIFGRTGYVGIRCLGYAEGTVEENREPLFALMGSVYFTEGHTYEDYVAGETVSAARAEQILVGTAAKPMRALAASMNLMNMIWFGLGSMVLMALYRWTIARARG